jgi:hypothetical protein
LASLLDKDATIHTTYSSAQRNNAAQIERNPAKRESATSANKIQQKGRSKRSKVINDNGIVVEAKSANLSTQTIVTNA